MQDAGVVQRLEQETHKLWTVVQLHPPAHERSECAKSKQIYLLARLELNQRSLGYEPNEITTSPPRDTSIISHSP